jgi:hypothetical protein
LLGHSLARNWLVTSNYSRNLCLSIIWIASSVLCRVGSIGTVHGFHDTSIELLGTLWYHLIDNHSSSCLMLRNMRAISWCRWLVVDSSLMVIFLHFSSTLYKN